jgi:hypothetical protein
MSAGRDVERLISSWLIEEATDRSRDRVLAAVRQAVDRMPQRRFGAAWRDPMYVSPTRLAVMAAALVVALLGGAAIGRMTAPAGGSGGPAPTDSPSGSTRDPLVQYRADRDAICERYLAATDPLRPQFEDLYNPEETAAERAPKIAALDAFADQYDLMVSELAALAAPVEIAADHAATVARYDAVGSLIHGVVGRLNAGDLAGAQSLDLATDPIAREIERFETNQVLVGCP